MSVPRIIARIVLDGSRAVGKGLAAAGQQAVRNMKYKPEGVESSSHSSGSGKSRSKISDQMAMSLEEAHLILNVKPEEPMEIIQKSYDRIFTANGPPPPPANPPPTPTPPGPRKIKTPTHSHYLQSKVYRALERIKAERDEGTGADGQQPTPGTSGAATPEPMEGGAPGGSEQTR